MIQRECLLGLIRTLYVCSSTSLTLNSHSSFFLLRLPQAFTVSLR